MTFKEISELLQKFDDIRSQKTFSDADIHTEYSTAYACYMKSHEGASSEDGLAFANFAAGYLKARFDERVEEVMGGRWERYGEDWIRNRFVSDQDNIFITTEAKGGRLLLYWFDDGPEIPTASVEISEDEFEDRVTELAPLGDQEVCEYLAGYFPDLQKHWMDKHGGI